MGALKENVTGVGVAVDATGCVEASFTRTFWRLGFLLASAKLAEVVARSPELQMRAPLRFDQCFGSEDSRNGKASLAASRESSQSGTTAESHSGLVTSLSARSLEVDGKRRVEIATVPSLGRKAPGLKRHSVTPPRALNLSTAAMVWTQGNFPR